MNTFEFMLIKRDEFFKEFGVYPKKLFIHESSLNELNNQFCANLLDTGIMNMDVIVDNDQLVCSLR